MLNLLSKNTFSGTKLQEVFAKVKDIYCINDVSEERKQYLTDTIQKYGYLPYPHYKVLDELTPSEIIYAYVEILKLEGTYENFKLKDILNPSPLARKKVKNSNWFKREGHNIKLISLSALGDGCKTSNTGLFIEWVAQILTLPRGNANYGVLGDTIYLLPFHPREFGCAYLPMSSDVSAKLEDIKLSKFLGFDAKSQVKLFITMAQLAGHPVIYDILPQTGRFSKIVLSKPYVARWFDINELINDYKKEVEKIAASLRGQFSADEIDNAKKLYLEILSGSRKTFKNGNEEILKGFESLMEPFKKNLSNQMLNRFRQDDILKKVSQIIEYANGKKPSKEEDILKQPEIVKALIKEGLWPAPGGAWCSCGSPVFDKMHSSKEYPMFRHFNYKGEDVTHFANLDCQTPYYFVYFENNKYNKKVCEFFFEYTRAIAEEYNFDGFRVDHIDHIVDDFSEKNKFPISYRAPREVLNKMNSVLKRRSPYFAALAEYMLWDDFYKEYHIGMGFDLLWGNDIVSQNTKTPAQIIDDNAKLEKYNVKNGIVNPLSILKTYNNQDGEFEAIDQYPGQLGADGALYKWFKYKFLPGGKNANRPSLYIDGDESFTKTGIEYIIGNEVSMKRNKDWAFYEKFNAINYFAQNSSVILNGKAQLIQETKEGLSVWEILSNEGNFLVVSNSQNPTEKKCVQNPDGTSSMQVVKGRTIEGNEIKLGNRVLVSFFEFDYDEMNKCQFMEKQLLNNIENIITFHVLKPAEFKVYRFVVK